MWRLAGDWTWEFWKDDDTFSEKYVVDRLNEYENILNKIASFPVQGYSPENYNIVIQQIQDLAKAALDE